MQCLKYLFYHLLSLQNRICVKGHQNILRPQEFYCARTAPPGFEIPGSATDSIGMGVVSLCFVNPVCCHFDNFIFLLFSPILTHMIE